jgi:hypothetical protein
MNVWRRNIHSSGAFVRLECKLKGHMQKMPFTSRFML